MITQSRQAVKRFHPLLLTKQNRKLNRVLLLVNNHMADLMLKGFKLILQRFFIFYHLLLDLFIIINRLFFSLKIDIQDVFYLFMNLGKAH